MKYVVEMGSGAMIYIPCFIKIDLGIQTLIGRDTHTQRARLSHKPIFMFAKCRMARGSVVG
jgi:hypothetical protein